MYDELKRQGQLKASRAEGKAEGVELAKTAINMLKDGVDVYYAQNRYNRIMELFRWMDIDGASLLYGLGRVNSACNQIDALVK